MTNIESFEYIINKLFDTYKKKNHDYGDSFGKTIDKYGLLSLAIRLNDKLSRFETLLSKQAKVNNESINDTLEDLATYAIMGLAWMNIKDQKEQNSNKVKSNDPLFGLKLGQIRKDVCPFGLDPKTGFIHSPKSCPKILAKINYIRKDGDMIFIRWTNCMDLDKNSVFNNGVYSSIYPISIIENYVGVDATI